MSEQMTDEDLAGAEDAFKLARFGFEKFGADPGWECVYAGEKLAEEVRRLRQQVAGHVERIAAQSELLSRRAEKPPGWSTELPVARGWYWWRYEAGDKPRMVEVLPNAGDGTTFFVGNNPVPALGGEWAGPLTPPADVPAVAKGCPMPSHHPSCDCEGVGGDR